MTRTNSRMTCLPLLLLLTNGISSQCITGNDYRLTMSANVKQGLAQGRFNFALESLKKAVSIEPKDNIFFSPHSLHQALTLAYFGARGTTEQSLKKVLQIPEDLSKIDVRRYYASENAKQKQRDSQANASSSYEFKSANKLWLSSAKKLRECMFDFFGDQLEKVDFRADPAGVRTQINNWVSNMTKGHIRDLLPLGSITEDSDVVLANAVYFKGLWQSKFDRANTKEDIFYISGTDNTRTTFMKQKGTFNHFVSKNLGAHFLELPYKGEEISMIILLPTIAPTQLPADSVRNLVERLSTKRGLKYLLRTFYGITAPVEVILPRFELERDLPLPTLLQALGAGELLGCAADLRGFVQDGEESLHVGDAVHRAKIEVTEEGTTAAGATAMVSFRSFEDPKPKVFNANHPFLYLIYDHLNRNILFAGIYRYPNPPSSSSPSV